MSGYYNMCFSELFKGVVFGEPHFQPFLVCTSSLLPSRIDAKPDANASDPCLPKLYRNPAV